MGYSVDMVDETHNQYRSCCQSMADATSADSILLILKHCLDSHLSRLSMLYFKAPHFDGSIELNLQLIAHLSDENEFLQSYEAFEDHKPTSPEVLEKKFAQEGDIVSLLSNKDINTDLSLQSNLIDCLPDLVDKNQRLHCFQLAASKSHSYWCVLVCSDNDSCLRHVTQSSMTILVLLNLALTHIDRIEALLKLKLENDRVQDELKQIAKLQRLLLPQDDLKIKGADIAANIRACAHAGGDYYDLTALTEMMGASSSVRDADFWGAMIADSAGHGAAAAVEISMFDAILRTINPANSTIEEGPSGVFNYANQYLFTRLIRGTFITAFVAGYNPETETISYSCAGHPPALLLRHDSKEIIELDQSNGVPLAVVKDFSWESVSIPFFNNDLFVLYTDGILEADNPEGEQFGLDRLKQVITDHRDLSSSKILKQIEHEVDSFQETEPRKDDQTLLILRRKDIS